MKSVGILTMHKVINYGSALQAYATQQTIEKLGYKAELIDYIYPNVQHKKKHRKNRIKQVLQFFLHLLQGFPYKHKLESFQRFWEHNFKLSTQTYNSSKELADNPPTYDIYVAGSDQIWNPRHIVGDSTFLLSFVPEGKKCISYASSFAQSSIDEDSSLSVSKNLKRLSTISVREKNGAKIIKELLNREANVCLDPTLLLKQEDYSFLEKQSSIHIDEPYILVYILQYAYNPYPYATQFIKEAHKQTGMKVVCLDFSAKQRLGIKNMTHLHDSVGPNEFVYLFTHAAMVITTSFHGTAFALNFGKSVYSLVNDKSTSDDRMKSLLDLCGVSERAIRMNSDMPKFTTSIDKVLISQNLGELREESMNYLKENLN